MSSAASAPADPAPRGARRILAAQAARYGSPEELRVVEGSLAAPAANEVTIETRAIGVNGFDAKMLSGVFGRDESALPLVPGLELAGVITAVGDRIAADGSYKIGDEVVSATSSGAYATSVNRDTTGLLRKPGDLTFEQAAGLVVVGGTAAQLVAAAAPTEGQTILIHGASGAVGRLAAQLAIAEGARVIGTASAKHHERLRELGVEPVAYGEGLEQRVRDVTPDGVAAALDTVGNDEAIDVSLAIVGDPQRVFTIAGFSRLDTGIVPLDGRPDQPAAEVRVASRPGLLRALATGELSFPIAATFPFEQAAEALTLVASGRAGGKVVLVVG
ncbi:NADP-dependent oxidoreductase [Pseudoclavibacter sp. AY1F1]|uniref:NADP-dependent oxidoreductase n=1 Tax=Pseudoclavibacter sp. AY1F1 TaxID=2080583 RepID=UPI0015E2F45B|nr:NADP-dependent oxidoreductase [Pseudoclavibacter sp. AY1F1]